MADNWLRTVWPTPPAIKELRKKNPKAAAKAQAAVDAKNLARVSNRLTFNTTRQMQQEIRQGDEYISRQQVADLRDAADFAFGSAGKLIEAGTPEDKVKRRIKKAEKRQRLANLVKQERDGQQVVIAVTHLFAEEANKLPGVRALVGFTSSTGKSET